MEKLDKDLQEIVDIVAEGVQTGIKQFSDGYQWSDGLAFIPIFQKIPAAYEDADNALHYLRDLTEEKENAVVDAVAEKLKSASDRVKEGARRILRLASEAYLTGMFFAKREADEEA